MIFSRPALGSFYTKQSPRAIFVRVVLPNSTATASSKLTSHYTRAFSKLVADAATASSTTSVTGGSASSSSTTSNIISPITIDNSHENKAKSYLTNKVAFKSTSTTAGGASTAVIKATPTATSNDDEDTETEAATTTVKKSKPWMMDLGLPSLVPEWKKMFSSETLFSDVSAGITVGCIAVPLSLAIAVASGVPAEVGLVTAAVSGVAGGLMGGTTLAVTGPAAAISLLVVGAVSQHGLEALPFITLACGGLQLASGVTRLGVAAKLVPISVIAGFTTGVGIMILSGQLPKAMGLVAPAGMNPIEVVGFIGENLSSINPAAAALAIGTSAAMMTLPKIHPKMPSALMAVGGATVATHALGLDVTLIGSIPSGLDAFQFGIPVMPSLEALPSLSATVLLIYAMTSAESLLSCAALEKMKKTTYKHNPDQELIGQGIANVGSAMFMGMPVTSVIARSSLNVRAGAESRLPSLVQSAFVFSSVAFLSSTISMIPMPALSGMLITTGMGMLNPAEFKHCYAVQKSDVAPFITTIGGMIAFGLAEGIGIGCLSALALNYNYGKLTVTEAQFPLIVEDDDDSALDLDKSLTLWKLNGPINFKAMFEIDNLMDRIAERRETGTEPMDDIVLDMHGVTSVEFTGVEELCNRLIEFADDGAPVQLVNCHDNFKSAMDQCDPSGRIARFSDPSDWLEVSTHATLDPDMYPNVVSGGAQTDSVKA
jgi:MFS superfamily sulfate permease-like transporter